MPDRRKVIKAIEICYTVGHNCTECPFNSEDECNDMLMRDVLALLREQEPVKPDYNPYYQDWYCGNCGKTIARAYGFCNHCGRKVKWNE